MKTFINTYGYHLIYLSSVLLVFTVVGFGFDPEPSAEPELTTLGDLKKESLDISIDTQKSLQSYAILIIGGMAALLLKKEWVTSMKSSFRAVLMCIVIITAVLSIYFGYILNLKSIEMLNNSMYNPSNELIEVPRIFQFFTFLISLVFSGMFVIDCYINDSNSKNS